MAAKPIYSLQIKAVPSVAGLGDARPWALDIYGVHDNFATPVIDDTTGALGPPPVLIGEAATERYTPCLLPTLARMQGFDSDAGVWRRVAVDADGNQMVTVDGFVSVLAPAVAMSVGVVVIGAVETLLLAANLNRRYVRFEVPALAVDVWASPAGLGTAAVGTGIRLLPGVAYTLDQFRFNTDWTAITAAGNVNVAYVEGTV